MVMVQSRRGKVELEVSVGKIAKGQVFIPFHFGYWDTENKRARAANELTTGAFSPFRSPTRNKTAYG